VCLELRKKTNKDPAKVGYTVLIQKNTAVVAVEEHTITKSKKGAADPEFNKEHAHCFSRREGDYSP
jgi:hypothetical protein